MTRLFLRLSRLLAPLSLGACATEYGQSSIDPKTDFAGIIHGIYATVFWWTVVILAVVWVVLGYVLVRYRERPGAPLPRQTHGHLGLEVAWTLGPALIVVAIAVPTIQAVFATQRGDPENAYVVEVVGHQFWWEYRYPEEGVVTANELHLPVGRPVSLRLHSADVIHSFWVPQLGGKRDVNPLVQRPEGESPRYNWLHFTVNEPGVYRGQCAEFCGEAHALMNTRVVVQTEEDFQGWLDAWRSGAPPPQVDPSTGAASPDGGDSEATTAAAPGPRADAGAAAPGQAAGEVALGREVFLNSTCVACHAIQGTTAQGQVGPNLTLFGTRRTLAAGWLENSQENLARWIASPRSIKPGALMPGVAEAGGNWPPTNLTEEQVQAVSAYLLSLR